MKLPFATEKSIGWVDAFFTSTSALTVTGLTVVPIGEVFTRFGQVIIMALIQIGGLGFMTFAILIILALGKKIGLRERMIIQESLNQSALGGMIRLVKVLLIFSFFTELIAAIMLSFVWIPEYGWYEGFFISFFHSVSAFNNAGFSLWSDSLTAYRSSPMINVVITFLFIIGG